MFENPAAMCIEIRHCEGSEAISNWPELKARLLRCACNDESTSLLASLPPYPSTDSGRTGLAAHFDINKSSCVLVQVGRLTKKHLDHNA